MSSLFPILVVAGLGTAIYSAVKASRTEDAEARTLENLPASVQHVVARMDGTTQAAFFNEYVAARRKVSVGYVLWCFFGFHYLYAHKVGIQFLYWITLGGCGIWALADLFRMPSIMRDANDQIARQALQTLHLATAYGGPVTA
jgi:hypothetical protein